MRRFRDRVAAITGAGSGIGRALALELAERGSRLALSDIDEEGLEQTRQRVEALGAETFTRRVDVADREAMQAWASEVEADLGAAHLVFNNAGVAVGASLRQVSYEDFEWLMNINFWGVVHGTRAFLPILERQEEAHIVNISSVFGLISVPMNGTYNAAKFAVRGFTEALRMELEIAELPIGVTCVHPGGIKTNIARRARNYIDSGRTSEELGQEFEDMARTTPQDCAKRILRGVEDNEPRVLVGIDARVIDVMQRLAPTGYQSLVKRLAKRRLP